MVEFGAVARCYGFQPLLESKGGAKRHHHTVAILAGVEPGQGKGLVPSRTEAETATCVYPTVCRWSVASVYRRKPPRNRAVLSSCHHSNDPLWPGRFAPTTGHTNAH